MNKEEKMNKLVFANASSRGMHYDSSYDGSRIVMLSFHIQWLFSHCCLAKVQCTELINNVHSKQNIFTVHNINRKE